MKKKTIALAMLCALNIAAVSIYADDTQLPAFPGAVGGGKYTEGARAAGEGNIEVYHVTNLNASGDGSFADAVSKSGRIIVFDVGGVIKLESTLKIRNNNLTILGQTAPGDGITVMGGDISFSDGVENVIMRHIRVRPTDINGGEPDGIGGRWNKNIILDHCSISWSVDEGMTLYAGYSGRIKDGVELARGSNITVQNCISSESLRMSNHVKGAHGYGAIVGAINSTWVNNLFAHHDSRSPRVDADVQSTDFKNNVIYNWGLTNSAYGAQANGSLDYSKNEDNDVSNNVYSTMNWTNNYYKYGPGTKQKIRSRIFDISNDNADYADDMNFYFNDNAVWADGKTNLYSGSDNIENPGMATMAKEENDMGAYTYEPTTAEEAYEYVLNNAGATLPRRDAVDARIINDVINHTGRIINNADEVGGWIDIEESSRVFKIPEDWIKENGFTSYEETDIISGGEFDGYTLIEAYVNEWTAAQEAPTNPVITVTSPTIAAIENKEVNTDNWLVITDQEQVTYMASAASSVGVTKMELYDRNTLIDSWDSNEINYTFSLEPGEHYLSCRAYNEKGEKTQSTTSIVYVNSTEGLAGGYEFINIGSGDFGDYGTAWYDAETQQYTISGSGKLFSTGTKDTTTGPESDSCGFMYKKVTGDFDIIVKPERIPKFENGQISGLMVRNSLASESVMWMLADGWLKYGENLRVISRETEEGNSVVDYFPDSNGDPIINTSSYDTSDDSDENYHLPTYMRIQRVDDTLTFSVSDSGTDWKDNPRKPITKTYTGLEDTLYVGIATDSSQDVATKEYFAQAGYSIVKDSIQELMPIGQPMKWVFDAYVETDVTTDGLIGNYIKSYGHTSMSIVKSTKTINNIAYTSTLKFGGTSGFNNGVPAYRVIEILPQVDGMLEVAFAHASSDKTETRRLAVWQGGGNIIEQAVEEPGKTAYLSCEVSGGDPVYIYSSYGALNIYGVYYKPYATPYLSFVSESDQTDSGVFTESHIKYGENKIQTGHIGSTYGNTISTGFTASITPTDGVSYNKLAWDITIPVVDTYIKIPDSAGIDGTALMLSDMIDPGECYMVEAINEVPAAEENFVGDIGDFLDEGQLMDTYLDWEMTDVSMPEQEETVISDAMEFTEEQLLEFAEFASGTNTYKAEAWDVSIAIADTAEVSDSAEVTVDKGAIYGITFIGDDEATEAKVQLQYVPGTTISGESTVTMGIIIDNLYAPGATATVMYYKESDTISDYQDVNSIVSEN